jgi:hypothetical protein
MITAADVARICKRPLSTVYRWIALGKLRSVQFNGVHMIPVDQMDGFDPDNLDRRFGPKKNHHMIRKAKARKNETIAKPES